MAWKPDNYIMVAALDFGTTYSGYAFSMRHDPKTIFLNQIYTSGCKELVSLKTPSCLLLSKEKEFVAFGYDAENAYAELSMDKKEDDYYFFHRFKMTLHNNKNITQGMVLGDVTGKTLTAVEVFKCSIKALVDKLMKTVQNQGVDVIEEQIVWVLTVPAIWTDSAKQFMRTSAEEAGISTDKLLLALEPETASIFCQYLPIGKLGGNEHGFTVAAEGTKYMVADIGGGTADITVHEKTSNEQLVELYRATGNDFGGTSVDKRFMKLLADIFGENVLTALKQTDPVGYLELEREFEAKKRRIEFKQTTTDKVTLIIPYCSLKKLCKKFYRKKVQNIIDSSPYSNEISRFKDKIRINYDTVRNLFKPTIDNIISLMKEILEDKSTQEVSNILMVGGFSECQLLQEAVHKNFPNKRIIIPEVASMAVLQGAVLFGHRPDYVRSRVMQRSYGIKTNVPFDKRKHIAKHRVAMDGEVKCDNIFSVIVEKDQQVEAGTVVKRSYFTPFMNQAFMEIMVYTSINPIALYIDDVGCEFLCKQTITFPDTCEEKRWVDVEYTFGNTEITLKAVDRNSGKEIAATFNLI